MYELETLTTIAEKRLAGILR